MDIPKVQVEAREDVLFLKSEFRKSVHQCLDSNRHLQRCREQSADKETDAQQHYTQLTGDIDTLISQWVDNIFQLAGPNIQVNGLEYNQAMRPNVVMDDYDESLHQETQQLQAEVEALTILVAEQRKTIPDMLETAVARQLEHRLQHLNDDLTGTNGTRNPPPVTNSQSPGSGKTASPVPERTRAEFDQALGSLLELQKALPATLARLDRVQTVLVDDTTTTTTTTTAQSPPIKQPSGHQQPMLLRRLELEESR